MSNFLQIILYSQNAVLAHEFVLCKIDVIAFYTCQNVVKEKNLISSCFRSNPYVCMIENCIVLYNLI